MNINKKVILSLSFMFVSGVFNGFELLQSIFDFVVFYIILFIIDETYNYIKRLLITSKSKV